MSDNNTDLHIINRQLIWTGFKQLMPLAVFFMVFGIAFGLAATQAGLDTLSSISMSALINAGTSQFAVLKLWGNQIPLFSLVITVIAINARHLLMGASLYQWLRHLPPSQRYGIMLFASDANWAMSMQAFNCGKPGMGILFGGGLAIWSFWLLGTWLGLFFGEGIYEPRTLGIDMVVGCFLLAMLMGGEIDNRMLTIWIVAAFSSLMAYWYLPENGHVIAGALAGGVLGAIWKEDKA